MAKDRPADAGKGWHGPDALRSLLVPIESLSPDPSNARKHGERNIDAIVASLHRFGQRFPVVVQKQGMIVRAGNGRIEAMKRLGWKNVAAVVVDESSVDATAFAIADNRTAELAQWDDEMRKKIEPLRKPYPKRAGSADSGTAGLQPVGGGANPTPALSQ